MAELVVGQVLVAGNNRVKVEDAFVGSLEVAEESVDILHA